MTASRQSAFFWNNGEASIFAGDARFAPVGPSKRSFSEIGSEQVARRTKASGKNPGTLSPLTRKVGKA